MMPAVDDACPSCVRQSGLCSRHAEHECPQLAKNIGWLKLMGEALAEQTRLQETRESTAAIEKAKRRSARKIARSHRRGYFGLALAISQRA